MWESFVKALPLAQPLPSETLGGVSPESYMEVEKKYFHISAQLGLSEQKNLEPGLKEKS